MKQYNPVTAAVGIFIITIVAILTNFGSAALEPLGETVTAMNFFSTIIVLGVWCYQSFQAGAHGVRGFLYFILAYWIAGIAMIWMVDLAMTTGVTLFADIGFFGLLLVMVPTYAVIWLAGVARFDYFWSYPVMLLLFLLCFVLGWQRHKRAEEAGGLEGLPQAEE